jgi:hypothetical protein
MSDRTLTDKLQRLHDDYGKRKRAFERVPEVGIVCASYHAG